MPLLGTTGLQSTIGRCYYGVVKYI